MNREEKQTRTWRHSEHRLDRQWKKIEITAELPFKSYFLALASFGMQIALDPLEVEGRSGPCLNAGWSD